MIFALGYIAGLVTAVLITVLYAVYSAPITRFTIPIKKSLENAGPRPKGYIIEPEDEATEVRREHIARNAEQGRDTPISELQ